MIEKDKWYKNTRTLWKCEFRKRRRGGCFLTSLISVSETPIPGVFFDPSQSGKPVRGFLKKPCNFHEIYVNFYQLWWISPKIEVHACVGAHPSILHEMHKSCKIFTSIRENFTNFSKIQKSARRMTGVKNHPLNPRTLKYTKPTHPPGSNSSAKSTKHATGTSPGFVQTPRGGSE